MKKIVLLAAVACSLAGCGVAQVNMSEMQINTAKTLGLASSDELTITNTLYTKKNAMGGTELTYDATTARGRRFACSAFVIPGLTPLDKASWTNGECHPK